MNRTATLHTRKNNKRDPLQGAPGHTEADEAVEPKFSAAADETADANAEASASQPKFIEDLVQKLGSVFGEESVTKWREMLMSSSADAQAAFFSMLRESMPNLPEKISLEDLSKLTDWQPAKSMKKHPVASAATVAAGIGAFFLVREYLERNPKAFSNAAETATSSIREVANRAKAYASKRASGLTKSASAKKSGSKSSSKKTTGSKAKATKGAKAKSTSKTRSKSSKKSR